MWEKISFGNEKIRSKKINIKFRISFQKTNFEEKIQKQNLIPSLGEKFQKNFRKTK